ncbi:MAG TPA: biotin transporter BioY [Gemmatimonadaceae bacterium]|nr:biotin transporter BioY [Gemmatimonadaceae bacterium]
MLARLAPTALDRTIVRTGAVLIMTLLTVLAAQISVPLPFTPVPFTLQPMLVLVGGAALGARLGATSQILYLALGIAGLPVFAASPMLPQGAPRLLGPTGGYLMAYPIAAFVVGYLAKRGFDRRYWRSFLAMAVGLAMIFACGVIWLATFAAPGAGLSGAIAAGFTPFVVADLAKLVIAAGILPTFWKFVR